LQLTLVIMREHQTFAYAYFPDERAATAAVQRLLDAGFDSEHIGVIMRHASDTKEVPPEHKTGIRPGAVLGSVLGAAAGAAALPAAGVIALGGAFAALGGAAVGSAGGTLAGVLGGLGVWKDELAVPHSAFEHGGVLVGATTSGERVDAARSALQAAGASETKLATQAEAQQDLNARGIDEAPRVGAPNNPDTLARNIFLLTVAYAAAIAASIWLFIRPV
jgi:hypothetical protein